MTQRARRLIAALGLAAALVAAAPTIASIAHSQTHNVNVAYGFDDNDDGSGHYGN